MPAFEEPAPRDPGWNPDDEAVRLPPRGKWFGFAGGLFGFTGRIPELDQGLTAEGTVRDALAAGVNSARSTVAWSSLEPRPGRVDWAGVAVTDRFVSALERSGGRPLLVLGSPPAWAAARPGVAGSPPKTDRATLAAFARYAAFVAKRWPRAVAIETWNEPSSRASWQPAPDAAAYVKLHKAAARAIREVNPDVQVLLGGLSTAREQPDTVRPQVYLKDMYAAGLRPADYDGLALHPYPGEEGPEGDNFKLGLEDFRLGHAWIDPRAALWVTETGASTTGPGAFSPERQAEIVVELVRGLLTLDRVRGVYVFTQYDRTSAPPDSPERGFGLLESHGAAPGTPKPGFCALRSLARRPVPFKGCNPG